MRPEPDPEARRIGDNVRRARRARGLSLEVVAGLAGRSGAWLSMIERGLRPLERRSDIAALAAALGVSPTDLLMIDVAYEIGGEPEGVPQLRELLYGTAIDDPPDVTARPLQVLADLAVAIDKHRHDADYARAASEIPPVLAELHVHAAGSDEPERTAAIHLLVDFSATTAFTARHLGAIDLAWIAADRARQAAAVLGDPVSQGAALFARAHAQPTVGQTRAMRQAAAAAERIRPHLGEDVRAHQVYGMLQLDAALAAQVQGDDDTAREHLGEARRIADQLGERPNLWNFGPANVANWHIWLEVEAGRPDKALAVVPAVDHAALNRNRRSALEIEVARAYAMLGRDREADTVQHLRHAERLAPDRLHHDPFARELVADMLDHAHRTAGGPELRGLAHRMKIAS